MRRNTKRSFNPLFATLFDDVFTKDLFNKEIFEDGIYTSPFTTSPRVNIAEGDDAFTIEFAVPGRKKEDFNLELDTNVLTVSFEDKKEEEKEGPRYTRREFRIAAFKRSFTLPEGKVDVDQIGAAYEDGILTLTVPKLEAAKQEKRKIEVV